MKTGFAKKCITPPMGFPVRGYYKPRFAKGILEDLYVRALAFCDGENSAVILSAEISLLTTEQCDEFRKVISDFCGLPVEAVFITCSHTHTGPYVKPAEKTETDIERLYYEKLKISFRDAAFLALGDLKESKFYTSEGKAKNISFIRRFRMKDGSVQTNPGVLNQDIDYPLGEPNETVKLLKITRENAEDVFLVNFGTHPDTIGGEFISPDYPGYVCNIVENALPGVKCMFLLGAQGDVNHINVNPTKGEQAITKIDFDNVPRGIEQSMHMARVIAGSVLSICTTAEELAADKIMFLSKKIVIPSYQENDKIIEAQKIQKFYKNGKTDELPYKGMELVTKIAEAMRIISLQNGPESYAFNLSAVRIGNIVFAGVPGEPFTEIGNSICEKSPFETTILCCLANGGDSYFPTSKAYLEGGYEAKTSRLAPGGDKILVNGMLELLDEVKSI